MDEINEGKDGRESRPKLKEGTEHITIKIAQLGIGNCVGEADGLLQSSSVPEFLSTVFFCFCFYVH